MNKSRKLFASLLLSTSLILTTGTSIFASPATSTPTVSEIENGSTVQQGDFSTAAISEYGPFYVRPTGTGQYDTFWVDLDSGQTSFAFTRYKVYGLHSGQQASIRWTIEDESTGEVVLRFTKGDVTTDSTFFVSNLRAGGTFKVTWESLNSNAVVGGTYIQAYGYAWK